MLTKINGRIDRDGEEEKRKRYILKTDEVGFQWRSQTLHRL